MRTAYSYLILPLAALYGPAVTAASATPPAAAPQSAQRPAPQTTQRPAPQAAERPAPAASGLTVARDTETGKLRAPTLAEQQALLRRTPAGRPATAPPPAVTGRHGERTVHLGERNLVYSVVTRGASGQLDHHCAASQAAAEQILGQPAATATPGDSHHEHR